MKSYHLPSTRNLLLTNLVPKIPQNGRFQLWQHLFVHWYKSSYSSPSMNVFSIQSFHLLRFGLFGRENSNVNGTFWVIFTRCREHMRLCIKCISKVSAVVKFMAAWVLVFQTCCCASLCAQHCVALRDHASKLCKVGSYLKMFLAWRCFYYSLGCREVRPVIRVPTCTRSHFPGAALQNHTGTEAQFLSKNCKNNNLHFRAKNM